MAADVTTKIATDETIQLIISDDPEGGQVKLDVILSNNSICIRTGTGQEVYVEAWRGSIIARHYTNQDDESPATIFEEDTTHSAYIAGGV